MQTVLGRMPVSVFANALLMGANRALVKTGPGVLQGPLKTHLLCSPLTGQICYPQSKKGVLAPSHWDPVLAQHSASLPEYRLELAHVFGYEGKATTSSNIAYNAAGEMVYFAAAVGIVYSRKTHTQRFFLGHNDDIRCLSMHPAGALVATGQLAAAETPDRINIVRRADPFVAVWSSESCEEKQRLFHGRGMRGVQCVAFSPKGGTLASICTDDAHSFFVWNWQSGQCLLQRKSKVGTPPAVYGIAWSGFETDRLATFGQNHVMFWQLRKGAAFEEKKAQVHITADLAAGQWGKVPTHTVWSALWLPCGSLLTGSETGALVTWRHGRAVDKVQGHDKGNPCRRPDGTPTHNGVRAIVLHSNGRCVHP
jgi:WD40 repeat protein